MLNFCMIRRTGTEVGQVAHLQYDHLFEELKKSRESFSLFTKDLVATHIMTYYTQPIL